MFEIHEIGEILLDTAGIDHNDVIDIRSTLFDWEGEIFARDDSREVVTRGCRVFRWDIWANCVLSDDELDFLFVEPF